MSVTLNPVGAGWYRFTTDDAGLATLGATFGMFQRLIHNAEVSVLICHDDQPAIGDARGVHYSWLVTDKASPAASPEVFETRSRSG